MAKTVNEYEGSCAVYRHADDSRLHITLPDQIADFLGGTNSYVTIIKFDKYVWDIMPATNASENRARISNKKTVQSGYSYLTEGIKSFRAKATFLKNSLDKKVRMTVDEKDLQPTRKYQSRTKKIAAAPAISSSEKVLKQMVSHKVETILSALDDLARLGMGHQLYEHEIGKIFSEIENRLKETRQRFIKRQPFSL